MESSITKNNNNAIIVSDDIKVYGDITLSDIRQSQLVPTIKEVILARYNDVPIKDLDSNEAGHKIKTLINVTLFESGFKTDNIEELIKFVVRDIFIDFQLNTLTEISLAFRKGVRGDYGDIMGMSVRTFYNWIRQYNEETRTEAFKSLKNIESNYHKPKPISKEEIDRIHEEWLNTFINTFDKYRKGEISYIVDLNNSFYNYCVKHGIGHLTNQEKRDMVEKAKEFLARKYNRMNARSQNDINVFSNYIYMIDRDEIDGKLKDELIITAKNLSLNLIFDKLINKNIHLKDCIEFAKQHY